MGSAPAWRTETGPIHRERRAEPHDPIPQLTASDDRGERSVMLRRMSGSANANAEYDKKILVARLIVNTHILI
jgi:hypothetical protein